MGVLMASTGAVSVAPYPSSTRIPKRSNQSTRTGSVSRSAPAIT
jgi:hypothetical protein